MNPAIGKIITLEPFGVRLELEGEPSLTDLARSEVMKTLLKEKLVLIRGVKEPTKQQLLNFARGKNKVADALVHWDFGPVMEMKVDSEKPNYLFSTEAVPYHWDGAFHEEPAILLFHCLNAPTPGAGGETIFANTQGIYERLNFEERMEFTEVELNYRTAKLSHYGGEVNVNMVQSHPHTGQAILRYAEPVRTQLNPVHLSMNGSPFFQEEVQTRMRELLYAPENMFVHEWQDGDILLADNFSLVHGRNAFQEHSPRHLRRVQIRDFQ